MTWPVPLPAETGDEVADLAAFAAWEQAREQHFHPERFGSDGARLEVPRGFVYYLGVPEASWLGKRDDALRSVPKFVSAARLHRYRSPGERWPVRMAGRGAVALPHYGIDSGAYIALTGTNKNVPWFAEDDDYGSMILRFIDNNGWYPDFVAPQDLPCEPPVLAVTGLTVRDHQDLTTDSYLWLVREFPMVPWIPVLQGWEPGDHADHANMYADAGVDLAACHRVGVGSICRLTELGGLVERIGHLEDLAASGLKLHGFGIKTSALPLIGHLLASADSMAWSRHVRHNHTRLPGCTHVGDCRNCYRYAVHWREKVLASLPTPQEAAMTLTRSKPAPKPSLFDDLAGFDLPAATVPAPRRPFRPARVPAPRAAAPAEDLFAGLVADFGQPSDLPRVIALADAEWGQYGEISGAFAPDGSKTKTRRGYITQVPRIATDGEGGTDKPRFRGKPMLSFTFELPAGNRDDDEGFHIGMLARPDTKFVLYPEPPNQPWTGQMRLSRRMAAADLRPGDVFYLWRERSDQDVRANVDNRARRHVQSEPQLGAGGQVCNVGVLVDGKGPVVTRQLPAYDYVDVEDPREFPWVQGHAVSTVPLPPDKGAKHGWFGWACVCGETSNRGRWSHADLAQSMGDEHAATASPEPGGPAGGVVAAVTVGDGLDEFRAVLARAALDGTTLRLPPEDLPADVWQALHKQLKQMGASGGSRKGQPYRFETDRTGDLRAFIAGGPWPKPERTTAGWVRTPDKLAASVVAQFVDFTGVGPSDVVRMLEPSAGDGALIRAFLKACPGMPVITAIEPSGDRRADLHALADKAGQRKFAAVHGGTLEEYAKSPSAAGRFNLALMNPPYSVTGNRTIWMDHVRLAWGMLADGGRLVAILPDVDWTTGKPAGLLAELGGDVQTETLPPRSFRESGTDFGTCVLAATKPPGGVLAARKLYAASIYRPAEGEPVQVGEVRLTRTDVTRCPVQQFHSFGGGEKVVRYVGRCIVCTVSCWSDGDNSPLGALGMQAVYPLLAEEHDMEGPDVCLCWTCCDSGIMHRRGEERARALWTAQTTVGAL